MNRKPKHRDGNTDTLPTHQTPFPCVVYVRQASQPSMYEFSHDTQTTVIKSFPPTLKVSDLHKFALKGPHMLHVMRKTCFLVLVAGDTAQCVSACNTKDSRTPFLYNGSQYTPHHQPPCKTRTQCSDVQEDYIQLRFYSTLAAYSNHGLDGVSHLESGIILFPKRIHERDLPILGQWVDHNITKALACSVWMDSIQKQSYNEQTHAIHLSKKTRT